MIVSNVEVKLIQVNVSRDIVEGVRSQREVAAVHGHATHSVIEPRKKKLRDARHAEQEERCVEKITE